MFDCRIVSLLSSCTVKAAGETRRFAFWAFFTQNGWLASRLSVMPCY
jgi:hypothetical protein